MEEISLGFILGATGGIVSHACYNLKFNSLSTDTRQIAPGSLFLALRGERFDGNDFLEEAFRKGAAACVASRSCEDGPVVLVPDTLRALQKLAAAYRRKFSIPVVGVTGSVGKTSTKEMIYTALSAKFRPLKNEGNRNNEIGMPLSVFSLDHTHTAAVFEMGMSGFGEISRLSSVAAPDIGVITNIGVSHMEKLGSQENILKAKLEIRDGLRPGGTLVLNHDDAFLRRVRPLERERIFTYGVENRESDLVAENVRIEESRTSFRVVGGGQSVDVNLPVCGRHHVYNALAALACARLLGIDAQEAARALAAYSPTGLRQRVENFHGVTLVADCYNASPDSMKSAFELLAALRVPGRRIAVLADMLELGDVSTQSHFDMGAAAFDSGVDILLTFGGQARRYGDGFQSRDPSGTRVYRHFGSHQALADALRDLMRAGDAVLFKGSRGMKLEEVIQMVCEGWQKK